MLTYEQIKELIELVSRHGLRGFEIERAGFRFKIDGQASAESVIGSQPAPAVAAFAPAAPVPVAAPATALAAPAAAPSAPAENAPTVDEDVHVLTSPIVGTFYRSPGPDDSPFVEVGDKVERGQVLCIVEAMKLMNEIESDVDGVVADMLPKNAQPVEFGEPLFHIRT